MGLKRASLLRESVAVTTQPKSVVCVDVAAAVVAVYVDEAGVVATATAVIVVAAVVMAVYEGEAVVVAAADVAAVVVATVDVFAA